MSLRCMCEMNARGEDLANRPQATRLLGPIPTLKEMNLICWGLFFAFLVLPVAVVSYTHYRSGEPLLKTGESDFVYLYGMGKLFNEHPAAELYDWTVQKKVCTDIHPIAKGEYGPIPYHPFIGMLFRPFATLPYLTAFLLWISISLAGYITGVLALSSLYFRDEPLARSLILCLAMAFYPFSWTIMAGHLSTLGFLAIAAALVQEHRGRAYLSGLALSICVYKPTLLVLILPMLFIARRWRTVMGFAAGAVGFALVATSVQGIGLWPGYLRMLFSFGGGAARVQGHTFKEVWKYVDASSLWSSLSSVLPAGLFRMVFPLMVACAGWVAFRLVRSGWRSIDGAEPARTLVWAATLSWTLVLNVYVPIYDCILVVLGVIATAGALKDDLGKPYSRCFAVIWLLILGCSWITTQIAENTGVQIITFLLAALGIFQLTVGDRVARAPSAESAHATTAGRA
jgi:hypothetical protein